MIEVSNDDVWKLVKTKDNIEVYARKLDDERFKEVKVIGKIKTTLTELVLAIEDVEAQKEWVIRTIESKVLETGKEGEFYYYVSTNLPFPVQDRDLVVYYERNQDPVTRIVRTRSRAVPDKLELQEGFIRIPVFDSEYVLLPKENGWIEMEYYLKVDPGGALPPWLVNLAISKGPYDTMESLFNIVKSGRYKGKKLSSIRN